MLLVAVVGILIGMATALTLRAYLTQQLDNELRSAGDRARGQYVSGPDDGPGVPGGPTAPSAPEASGDRDDEVCGFDRDDDDRRDGDGGGDGEPGGCRGSRRGP